MSYIPSDRGQKLWTFLAKRYGTKFIHDHGERCNAEWDQLVARSTDAAIRQALQRISDRHPQYAPTLPQFQTLVESYSGPVNVGPSVIQQLRDHVVRTKPLTPMQIRAPWTYLGTDRGATITGCVVPADGAHPGYRVMVVDIEFERDNRAESESIQRAAAVTSLAHQALAGDG